MLDAVTCFARKVEGHKGTLTIMRVGQVEIVRGCHDGARLNDSLSEIEV